MAINRRQKANCIVCNLINQNVQAAPLNQKTEIEYILFTDIYMRHLLCE